MSLISKKGFNFFTIAFILVWPVYQKLILQVNQPTIVNIVFPGCQVVDNHEHVRLGRIWILHDDTINLSVHSSSEQVIHCHLYSTKLQRYFFLSIVYASNSGIEIRLLWRELVILKNSMPSQPWVDLGDFNVIHNVSKRFDFFAGMAIVSTIQEFHGCLTETGLVDIPGKGP